MPKPVKYYSTLPDGRLQCAFCLKIYSGAFAVQDARNCCKEHKPIVPFQAGLRQAESILKEHSHTPTPRTGQPGDGTEHPDRWGHWRRGKPGTPDQNKAELNKAWGKMSRELEAAELAALDKLFDAPLDTEIDAWLDNFHRSMSPEQKIAWSFKTGRYYALKDAVNALVRFYVKAREKYILLHPHEYGLQPIPGWEPPRKPKYSLDINELLEGTKE